MLHQYVLSIIFFNIRHYFFLKINYQKSYKIVVAESLIINADKMENVCKLNAKRIYLYESDFY